jgi:CheY-like chemotaxis protein
MSRNTLEPMGGRVLVVDPDYDTLSLLARVLRARGHQVVLATDGRTGLARAVEIAADVVLLDAEIPILDARTFLEVMRDNPRTATTHAFVMARGDAGRQGTFDARAEPILKPFNADEVAARVEDVVRARRAPQTPAELKGDLEQVALFDLLQVFAANHRTGKLHVEAPGGTADVWVQQGRIADAVMASAMGDKALYRILALREGRFVFLPDVTPPRLGIDAPTDHLLMEAVRQADEVGRLRDELPPPTAHVHLEGSPEAPSEAARVIMAHLHEPLTVQTLLDRVPMTDLRVLEGLRDLLASGAIRVDDGQGEVLRFAAEEDLPAMRAAALRLRRPGVDGPPRLAVMVGSHDELSRFLRALGPVHGFVPAREAPVDLGLAPMGPVGALRFDGADLELFALPAHPTLRPLVGLVLGQVTAALSLTEADAEADASQGTSLTALVGAMDVRLVRAAAGWDQPAGAIEAVRAVLGAVTPVSSSSPLA